MKFVIKFVMCLHLIFLQAACASNGIEWQSHHAPFNFGALSPITESAILKNICKQISIKEVRILIEALKTQNFEFNQIAQDEFLSGEGLRIVLAHGNEKYLIKNDYKFAYYFNNKTTYWKIKENSFIRKLLLKTYADC